jgi:hypothetical protein
VDVGCFHSLAGFIVAFALHLHLLLGVNLGLCLATVQRLSVYLHMTLTRPVDRDYSKRELDSPCLEIPSC